jgi:arylsulfatase A-like enzyme
MNRQRFLKIIPIILIICGVAAILIALTADYFHIGRRTGIGGKQISLALSGLLSVGVGILLNSPLFNRIKQDINSYCRQTTHPLSILIIGVWFGLVTGFVEVFILSYRMFILVQKISLSKNFPWMVPLGYTIIFLIPGIISYLITRIRSNFNPLRITIFIFSFLCFLSWITLLFSNLELIAILLLTIGLAFQMSRFVIDHPKILYWTIRRTILGLTTIFILLGIGVLGWQILIERYDLSKLPPAPVNAPNVLLIVMDTVRAQDLSLYGYIRKTSPQLENVAQSGIIFTQAYATSSWTLPSHGSIFMGRWPHELSAGWFKPLDNTYPTLAEVFADHGYNTAGFIANTLLCSYEDGLNRGFIHYEDYTITPSQIIFSPSIVHYIIWKLYPVIGETKIYQPKTAKDVNDSFLRWLSSNNDRPFYAFLNYFDAHSPYQPPKPFDSKFSDNERRANSGVVPKLKWSPQEVQADLDAYDGTIAYIDEQVGQLVNELEKRKILENTLLVITSDHGEEFGEHKLFEHGNNLYIQSLHVPLIIIFPSKAPAGKNITTPVSLREIPATILDLTDMRDNSKFPGTSFRAEWQISQGNEISSTRTILSELESKPWLPEDLYPIAKGDMKSLVINQYQYIMNGDGSDELYNIDLDPAEKINLALNKRGQQLLPKYRKLIEQSIDKSP